MLQRIDAVTMDSLVLSVRYDHEISDRVIKLVTVYVMDVLGWFKLSAFMAFHYMPVLKYQFFVNSYPPVPLLAYIPSFIVGMVRTLVISILTLSATELAFIVHKPVVFLSKCYIAVYTNKTNYRGSGIRIFTDIRTKLPLVGSFLRVAEEGFVAMLTGLLDPAVYTLPRLDVTNSSTATRLRMTSLNIFREGYSVLTTITLKEPFGGVSLYLPYPCKLTCFHAGPINRFFTHINIVTQSIESLGAINVCQTLNRIKE